MYKIGEMVRWRSPLDEDYSYGIIVSLKRSIATIAGRGYYAGKLLEVHLKDIEKLGRGDVGGNGRSKRSL